MMKLDKNFLLKRVLPVLGGAVLGFAYYYFIGCNSGSCPITSSPYVSTVYGAFAGFILSMPGKNKKKEEVNNEESKENN